MRRGSRQQAVNVDNSVHLRSIINLDWSTADTARQGCADRGPCRAQAPALQPSGSKHHPCPHPHCSAEALHDENQRRHRLSLCPTDQNLEHSSAVGRPVMVVSVFSGETHLPSHLTMLLYSSHAPHPPPMSASISSSSRFPGSISFSRLRASTREGGKSLLRGKVVLNRCGMVQVRPNFVLICLPRSRLTQILTQAPLKCHSLIPLSLSCLPFALLKLF